MTETERKVALITGITGQDGSYLAEFLIAKGYTVSALNFSSFFAPMTWCEVSTVVSQPVGFPFD